MLDEVEELDLVLGHYAITWGVKSFNGGFRAFQQWGLHPKVPETSEED